MTMQSPATFFTAPSETASNAILAVVNGEVLSHLPPDLYIPSDSLNVFLETFEGPLDLLLYLIQKQRLDVLNIPIAQITRQYMQYVALIREVRFELAADYLVMAAVLAEIKSRMLLPMPSVVSEGQEDLDPRAELVRRLQEYQRFQKAANDLDKLPRLERDCFIASAQCPDLPPKILPTVHSGEIIKALQRVLSRFAQNKSHRVERASLSVHERMSSILLRLSKNGRAEFGDLLCRGEGRHGVVVTFIAVLELLKQSLVTIVQAHLYDPIQIIEHTVE